MQVFVARNGFYLKWLAAGFFVLGLALLMIPGPDVPKPIEKNTRSGYFPFVVNHFTVGLRPENYEFLFSDKPESLYVFQDAELVFNRAPALYRAEMRIRGTHAWNWDYRKPSFRLRLKGQKRIMGRQILDFITPDDASMLANLVSDHIAVELGMPSPRTTIATAMLNNEYKGLYHLAEPVNVATLQEQGFTACTVLEGNIRNSRLWNHPEVWEIESPAGLNDEKPRQALKCMLEAVQTPVDFQKIEKLPETLDTERFAAWSALMTAIASIHTNDYFGHLLVYDHQAGRLFPVIADPSGFGVITSIAGMHAEVDIKVPLYEFLTPLANAWFRFPQHQFRRNQVLFKMLHSQFQPERLRELVDGFMAQLRPLFYRETYASALINIPLVLFSRKIPVSPQAQEADAVRLLSFMKDRREFLLQQLASTEVKIVQLQERATSDSNWFELVAVRVRGHCPVVWDFSTSGGKIIPDVDFDGALDSALAGFYQKQLFFPGLKETRFSEPHWLMPGRRKADFILEPDYQTYILGIRADCFAESIEFLTKTAKNAVTEGVVAVEFSSSTTSSPAHSPEDREPCKKALHAWRNWKNVAN